MKRLESNLMNMALSLTIVAIVAAALLGGMYVLTEEPIAASKEKKQMTAKTEVLPAVEGIRFGDVNELDGVMVYPAFVGDQKIGAAVETFDKNGFNGRFSLMVGFDADGNITGYKVLEQNETPGLGANMENWFKTDKANQSIIGLNPAEKNMTVSKDGGDVDAITAATITSRAFLRAVNRAYEAYMVPEADGISGATAIMTDSATVALSEEQTTMVETVSSIEMVELVNDENSDNNE